MTEAAEAFISILFEHLYERFHEVYHDGQYIEDPTVGELVYVPDRSCAVAHINLGDEKYTVMFAETSATIMYYIVDSEGLFDHMSSDIYNYSDPDFSAENLANKIQNN